MLGKARFTIGFIVGSIVFGSSAFAATTILATNTPNGGYLLCFNSKTKAVTYPGTLSCPTGTKALDLGASRGKDGTQGEQGPEVLLAQLAHKDLRVRKEFKAFLESKELGVTLDLKV